MVFPQYPRFQNRFSSHDTKGDIHLVGSTTDNTAVDSKTWNRLIDKEVRVSFPDGTSLDGEVVDMTPRGLFIIGAYDGLLALVSWDKFDLVTVL